MGDIVDFKRSKSSTKDEILDFIKDDDMFIIAKYEDDQVICISNFDSGLREIVLTHVLYMYLINQTME